jgi:hypothetical protein
MPVSEDVARSIIRNNAEEISTLSPEDRISSVKDIMAGVEKSIQTKGDIDPDLQKEIAKLTALTTEEPTKRSSFALVPQLDRLKKKASQQAEGISTDEPLPAGDLEIGFGVNPEESLSKSLTKYFGKRVTTFKRDDELFYVDPELKVVKKANPNILGKAGLLLPVAGDIAGTIGGGALGAAVTKTPSGAVIGEAFGSGLGTGGAEYVRLSIGKSFGMHDLSQKEMVKEAAKKGAISTAATGAVGGIVALTKGVGNFIKGHIFTADDALRHGLTKEQGEAVISEVNDILGKKAIKGTLFKLTDDPIAGSAEAEVRGTVEHAGQFIQRDLSDQKALSDAFEIVTKPSKAEGGQAVQDVLGKQIGKRITQAKDIVIKNVDELQKRLSSVKKETVGKPTRDVILAKQQVAKSAEKSAWEEVKKAGGFSEDAQKFNIAVPIGDSTKKLRTIAERRSESAFTDVTRKTSQIFSKNAKVADLEDYKVELSNLRAASRAISKNKQFGDPDTKSINEAVSAMVEDRRLHLIKIGKEDLLKKIESAEKKTFQFNETFNRSVVGDLTKKDESGVFKIQAKQFVDKVLKGDSEEAKQLLTVIGDNPTLMTQWKEGISNAFERDVLDKLNIHAGTTVKPPKRAELIKKTSDWIDSKKDVLEQFFTKEELDGIKKTGDLAVLVKKQIAQQERIIKSAEKTFGRGKLTSLDPDNLVKFVTNDSGSFITPTKQGVQSSLRKIRFVKNVTKDHPGAWNKFKEEFSTSINKEALNPDTGLLDPKKISNIVNKQPENVREIMGEEYLRNLRSINRVAHILAKTPKSLRQDETQRGLKQLVRGTGAPPLTQRGRLFTALLIFNEKQGHKVIADSLLNPENLKRVVELSKHSTLTRQSAELAASLGFLTE